MRTKADFKSEWIKNDVKFTNDEFEFIWLEYKKAVNCDLCKTKFKNSLDKQLEHNHDTGEVRNIVCRSCNQRKEDRKVQCNSKTGLKYISKKKCKTTKFGFSYEFRITEKNSRKRKNIKSSVNLEYLIKFRDQWLKENNYNT
jgi:hypothetical protein